jgi:hypothetical protein
MTINKNLNFPYVNIKWCVIKWENKKIKRSPYFTMGKLEYNIENIVPTIPLIVFLMFC